MGVTLVVFLPGPVKETEVFGYTIGLNSCGISCSLAGVKGCNYK